jgi:PAS domain-containing protein
MFPRVLVKERQLSGEEPAWYVYRDGRWTPPDEAEWWTTDDLPRVVVSLDGWIHEANQPARGLLGIPPRDREPRFFTDFVAPGTLDDSQSLFNVVASGHDLTATVLLKPAGGELIACDLHAARESDAIVGVFRLAEDVQVVAQASPPPAEVVCHPASDAAFRGYTELLMSRMPEPSVDGLAIRLHRLYPHARVEPSGARWMVFRDASGVNGPADGWWLDQRLPRIRYDPQALIVEANDAARELLGPDLVGHHWQDLATPGSIARVAEMVSIIMKAGVAISRFRMPARDGSLVEFDSFTEYDGQHLTSVMRPL